MKSGSNWLLCDLEAAGLSGNRSPLAYLSTLLNEACSWTPECDMLMFGYLIFPEAESVFKQFSKIVSALVQLQPQLRPTAAQLSESLAISIDQDVQSRFADFSLSNAASASNLP